MENRKREREENRVKDYKERKKKLLFRERKLNLNFEKYTFVKFYSPLYKENGEKNLLALYIYIYIYIYS